MTDTTIIRTEDLTKAYGKKVAVNHLSLQIRRGEIFGLLGPNGAGKTTTILMLLGLTEPTQGRALIDGYDCTRQSMQVKRITGYMPDNVGFLWVLAFNLLGGALFLVGATVAQDATRPVLMALGGCVWLGGIIGSMIALFLRRRSATKKRLAELCAAPNDPEKLPVIDVPETGGEWDMWNMG